MVTIYELLEVEEDASKEEIEKAYSKLVLEFRQDIKFDAQKNKENEMIINKLKLAYEILTNDEKRKRYDYELAQKRAENLIKNVTVSNQEESKTDEIVGNNNISTSMQSENKQTVVQSQESTIENSIQNREVQNTYQEEVEEDVLTKNEKAQIRKAAQKEFKQKLKKVKQAEEEYNEAYNKAYNDYLRKMGYNVKEPWTLKRVKRTIIAVLILILTCFILWHIPPIRKMLYNLYEQNFIIKALVDIIKTIINAIFK